MGIQITLDRFEAQILGRELQFHGQMEPVGRVLDYFNSANRSTFPLYDARVFPIQASRRFSGITRPEINVSDWEIGLVFFADAEYRQRIQLLKTTDPVIAYTPRAILRGNFHRGAETRLGDLFSLMRGSFFAMTKVSIFPTVDLPSAFPEQADVLIVNRHYVNFYHPE